MGSCLSAIWPTLLSAPPQWGGGSVLGARERVPWSRAPALPLPSPRCARCQGPRRRQGRSAWGESWLCSCLGV